ncbi:mechanosensitive ion channel family protein [Candidatus Nanohalovita haloferacivicina]|uniref:mechanosensitive ion channel family protein n=1 Tax=Candidatus Nanohalovita haloferacivicina TaxID=2978046 RepID=UPI00325FB1C5|nr:Small-conductance mechanosensitive channel [Candidatus Nanohalobia archaeon BNXNv]
MAIIGTLTSSLSGIPLPSVNIGPELVIAAAAVMFAGWGVNKLSDYLIAKSIERRNGDKHVTKTSQRISSYVIYSLTAVALLGVFGVPLSALGTMVGLIGLGLSFALKDMIANFISGLLIMINRPFKIGDQIEVSGEAGTVRDIKIRASEIKTYDGRKVIVPNSTLYSNTVINNTAYDERRFEVVVGVGYDDDVEKAKDLAMETLEEAEMTEDDPEPQVLVHELGGSSVNLKLRGWTKPSKANMVKASSEVTQLVKDKYDDAGIDIPYPIRTIYMEE